MARPKYTFRDVFYPRVAVVGSQAEANEKLADGVIVLISGSSRAKSLKMQCPCGCGTVLSINLMREAGRAWRMVFEGDKGISLYPSVWLDVGCEVHFILRRNTARVLTGRVPQLSEEEIDGWWA